MKRTMIPLISALGCSLTACGEKEEEEIEETDVDTEDTSSDPDTEVPLGDITALIGLWNLDSYSVTYYGEVYETTFPDESVDNYEGYGLVWTDYSSDSLFDMCLAR